MIQLCIPPTGCIQYSVRCPRDLWHIYVMFFHMTLICTFTLQMLRFSSLKRVLKTSLNLTWGCTWCGAENAHPSGTTDFTSMVRVFRLFVFVLSCFFPVELVLHSPYLTFGLSINSIGWISIECFHQKIIGLREYIRTMFSQSRKRTTSNTQERWTTNKKLMVLDFQTNLRIAVYVIHSIRR